MDTSRFFKSFGFLFCFLFVTSAHASDLATMETLGELIYFDENLSEPRVQSCASCHDPAAGFASPNFFVNLLGGVEPGAVHIRAGNRKPPTASYSTFAEDFELRPVGPPGPNRPVAPEGGLFWDGRATGKVIDSSIFPDDWSPELVAIMEPHANAAADQAMGPFLNDVEQNLPSAEELCLRVQDGSYADVYADAWGAPIDCSEPLAVELAHKRIAFAVSVFEASSKVNSFSSFRDIALASDADGQFPLDAFSDQENLGHDLFYNTNPGGPGFPRPVGGAIQGAGGPGVITCARFCHSSSFGADGSLPEELYVGTAATYFNIGVPRNPFNPWYWMRFVRDDDGEIINKDGWKWVDLGLGFRDDDGTPGADFPDRMGQFKMTTIRNVASVPFEGFVKAYMHNGYFKSLKDVVHFYNTRDLKPVCTNRRGKPQKFVTARQAIRRGCWPVPEVYGRVDDNEDGVIDENDAPNIFGCNRNSDCKVELSAGMTFENYCDDNDGDGFPDNPLGIGNLCLTDEQENALVKYMETLTDLEVME